MTLWERGAFFLPNVISFHRTTYRNGVLRATIHHGIRASAALDTHCDERFSARRRQRGDNVNTCLTTAALLIRCSLYVRQETGLAARLRPSTAEDQVGYLLRFLKLQCPALFASLFVPHWLPPPGPQVTVLHSTLCTLSLYISGYFKGWHVYA